MKTVELKYISYPIAQIIRLGKWSLYEVNGGYVVQTEPQTFCCNPHRPQKNYLLDESGVTIGILDKLPDEATLVQLK